MKLSHCLFCFSVAGREYKHLCWFSQQGKICTSISERQHCETLLAYHWTHRTLPCRISPIIAQRRSAYENDSFHYITACMSAVLPVGGLQRPCRNLVFLNLGVGRLREDQFIYVDTRENMFFMIWDLQVLGHILIVYIYSNVVCNNGFQLWVYHCHILWT